MARFQLLKDLSIKNKIIAIVLFIAFTAISIGFTFITIWNIKKLKTETQSHLLLDATLIGDYCIVPLTFGNRPQATEALSRLKYIESVDEGYLFDESGNHFASYPDSISKPPGTVTEGERSATFRDGNFFIMEPISFDGTRIGTLYLKANSKLLAKETQNLAIILSSVFLIILIISYLLAVWLQKLFTKPILKLADMTAAISLNQDFTLQLEPYGKDEIGFLYQQFNNLLSQLLKRQNERDKAEKEISFLAQVLRNISEFVSITDLHNKITFVNQSWLKTFGYSNEEVIGQQNDIIVSPANRSGIINEILSATLNGGWEGEVYNRRKDGSDFPVRLVTTIIYDNASQPVALVGISNDISYRKKAEKKLILSESRYRSYVEATGQIAWVTNADGEIAEDLPSLRKFTGQSYEEIKGSALTNLLHPDDIKHAMQIWKKAVSAKNPYEAEYRMLRHDGVYRHLLARGFPVIGEDGIIIEWVGTCIDITERKLTEIILKESEEKFRRLIEKIPLPLCFANKEGVIIFRNERFIKVFGYTDSEVPTLGEWWNKAYPDEKYRQWVIKNWESAIKHAAETNSDIESDEYHVTCKDGTVREIIISGITINEDFLATFIDYTERKQEEDKIIAANKELAFQNDEKGKRAAELVIANKELAFQNREKERKSDEFIMANKELAFQNEEKEKRAAELIIANKELVYQNSEKEKRAAELILANKKLADQNIEKGKRANELIIANRELAVQNREKEKRADELNIANKELAFQNEEKEKRENELVNANKELVFQIEEKEKQKAENKELEAFTYSVSHDLRAPLRHIGGFIDLLIKNSSSQLDETGKRYLNIISDSSQEMGNLIDALLTFSRLGRTELQVTKINSKKLVNQVIKTFSEEMTGRDVTINVTELPDVMGDSTLINQVWINLISNAIKYSKNIEKSVIDIGAECEDGNTVFYVKDNGAGFDMKYADKLFGVFQRLHKARDFEGIGIGLANVNRIVMRHGGKCWAESEVGKGAKFFFSMPGNEK
jgi:PAS domain S-box-containing protein